MTGAGFWSRVGVASEEEGVDGPPLVGDTTSTGSEASDGREPHSDVARKQIHSDFVI